MFDQEIKKKIARHREECVDVTFAGGIEGHRRSILGSTLSLLCFDWSWDDRNTVCLLKFSEADALELPGRCASRSCQRRCAKGSGR